MPRPIAFILIGACAALAAYGFMESDYVLFALGSFCAVVFVREVIEGGDS